MTAPLTCGFSAQTSEMVPLGLNYLCEVSKCISAMASDFSTRVVQGSSFLKKSALYVTQVSRARSDFSPNLEVR